MGRGDRRLAAAGLEVSRAPTQASQAQFSIAETLEEKLGKLEEALEEYRKVTWGSIAPARPSRPSPGSRPRRMTVATERVFRSDETPKLEARSRGTSRA